MLYGVPTLVDEMEDAVNSANAAWPDRLYLIGLKGEVIYAGGIEPFGFKPDELKKAIDDYLTLFAVKELRRNSFDQFTVDIDKDI